MRGDFKYSKTTYDYTKSRTLYGGFVAELTDDEYNAYTEWAMGMAWYMEILHSAATLNAMRIHAGISNTDAAVMDVITASDVGAERAKHAFGESKRWVAATVAARKTEDDEL